MKRDPGQQPEPVQTYQRCLPRAVCLPPVSCPRAGEKPARLKDARSFLLYLSVTQISMADVT